MTVSPPTVGTQVENTTAQNHIDLPYPATSSGQLLLLGVTAKATTQPTLPGGWTPISSTTNTGAGGQPSQLLACKSATGSETGNLTVTTPITQTTGQIWAIDGVDLTNPLNVAKSEFNQTTGLNHIDIPGITTGSDGCLLVVLACNNTATNTATPPVGFTETADRSAGQQTIEFCYNQQSTHGATGTETVNWSGTGQALGVLIALNPRVNAGNAAVTVTANDATVAVPSVRNAPAENTDVAVTANDATISTNKPQAQVADVIVTANDAAGSSSSLFVTTSTPAGSQVRPGIAMRVRAVYNGITYDVWRGHVDSWDLGYFGVGGDHATAAANGSDVVRMVSAVNLPAATVPGLGAGDDTGTRIARILDAASWTTVDRVLSTGDSTLQATDLSGNAWDQIVTAARSEGGDVFADPAGRIVFHNRRFPLENVRSTTPQATFGDQPGELKFNALAWSFDDDAQYNLVGATNVGGVRQEASDGPSADRDGARTLEESGLLLQNDSDAANWAGYVVFLSKDAEYRIESLTITPRADPDNLFPVILSLGYGDRIRLNLTPPTGPRISRDLFIRGIQHTITPTGEWTTTYVTQSATKFVFWTLGDATLGKIGVPADGSPGNALSF